MSARQLFEAFPFLVPVEGGTGVGDSANPAPRIEQGGAQPEQPAGVSSQLAPAGRSFNEGGHQQEQESSELAPAGEGSLAVSTMSTAAALPLLGAGAPTATPAVTAMAARAVDIVETPAIVHDARAQWLLRRRGLITASDVAAILNVDVNGRTPWSVYAAKVGGVEQDETPFMRRGKRMESILREEYQEATGRPVLTPENPYELRVHPEIPWLGATLDAETSVAEMPLLSRGASIQDLFATPHRWVPLELKTGGDAHADLWKDGQAPLGYLLQVHIQIACVGASWGALTGLLSLNAETPEVRDVPRDDELLNAILPRLAEFFWRIRTRTPPPVDAAPATTRAIKGLYPEDRGQTVDLDHDAVELAEEWERAADQVKAAESKKAGTENALRVLIGDASFGALADGSLISATKTDVRASLCACGRETRSGYSFRRLRHYWPRLSRRNR